MYLDAVIAPVPPREEFRVVVAAGGTGGHIFPAVAVVEHLERLTGGRCAPVFMGSRDRMETTLIPKLGYPYVSMPIEGFRGLALSTLSLPLKVMTSIRIARDTIRKHRPHAVICTGAYIRYPVGIAAVREKVPLIVLESNLNPGKSNARLAPKATAVVLAFEETMDFFPAAMRPRLHVLGNPVRAQVDATADPAASRRAFGLDPDRPTVFVFGGSLGAHSINLAIERARERFAAASFQMIWQTGKGYTGTPEMPSNVVRLPFVENMGAAYAAADLVVARSGATTVAELGIVGKPAVFVPLPSASTNEQQHNAAAVERRGAAIVVRDASLREELFPVIEELMSDASARTRMATAMHALGRPTAAHDAAQLVLHCGGWEGGT
jgi:UDP-N-acetylglucosamine--N-acetylmuramyl-(pentapeptide) pyrophosphoryl-undecaprenol N-acetylglucosamine transferase